ncbi:MAG: hypothetical protein AB7F50_05925 [Fimbriimonadaceae bacterium]
MSAGHAAALGLDPGELAAISDAKDDFVAAFASQEAARAVSIGATARADQEWRRSLDLVSSFNAQFQAIPGISPELLGELGLTVREEGGSIPVFAPGELSALGSSNGVTSLRWQRNGNEAGTIYMIEVAYDGTSDWHLVDATTRPRYDHADQVPGRFTRYRVYAQRGSTKSPASNTAAVYDPPAGRSLAAAA